MEIMLNKPRTINLQPNEIALVLDALAEKPFKQVTGLVNNIVNQLKQQEIQDELSTRMEDGSVQRGNGVDRSGEDLRTGFGATDS